MRQPQSRTLLAILLLLTSLADAWNINYYFDRNCTRKAGMNGRVSLPPQGFCFKARAQGPNAGKKGRIKSVRVNGLVKTTDESCNMYLFGVPKCLDAKHGYLVLTPKEDSNCTTVNFTPISYGHSCGHPPHLESAPLIDQYS